MVWFNQRSYSIFSRIALRTHTRYIYIYIYIYIYEIHMYLCMYIYINKYIHTHTHARRPSKPLQAQDPEMVSLATLMADAEKETDPKDKANYFGCLKGPEESLKEDVDIDVDTDRYFDCLKGLSKSGQVLLDGMRPSWSRENLQIERTLRYS